MACGSCGNKSVGSTASLQAPPGSRYVFTHPETGRQTTYDTIYEAEFAKMRAGGGSITVAPT